MWQYLRPERVSDQQNSGNWAAGTSLLSCYNVPNCIELFSSVYLCDMIVENVIAPQYIETNMMHFLFSLFRIKGLYMFRALLAHPQEALHKRHLVYC
jgi:hypothetical protein